MAAKRITLPASKELIRSLRIGDEVRLNGTIVTGRDMAHKYMVEKRPDFIRPLLKDGVIYHCGPIVKRIDAGWQVVAAGPTTSSREEPYQATVIREYGPAGVIGKGGMGERTLAALEECGAVYLHAVGGAGALLAGCIERVKDVFMLHEFGAPEAFWVLEVRDFPAVVTMDSLGQSLHEMVRQRSQARLSEVLG